MRSNTAPTASIDAHIFVGPRISFLFCLLLVFATACDDEKKAPPLTVGEIFATLGEPVPFATDTQREAFERGRQLSLHTFTPSEGLGPTINVVSCGSCHEKPVTGGGGPRYRNFQLVYAQLSDGSTVGVGKNGVLTQFDLGGDQPGRAPTHESGNLLATRNPIPFFGVGLLAEIDEDEILSRSDPNDRDGDGISGRPNWDRGFVGRFGRKAQTVSIEGFIRGPLFNHLGITSNPLPDELRDLLPVPSASTTRSQDSGLRLDASGLRAQGFAQAAAPDAPLSDEDSVPDPELSDQDLFDLVSFSMLLAPPTPDERSEAAERGAKRFDEIGCVSCHVPALKGPRGLVPAYTDVLLHDLGEALADGVEMGEATGSEYRTAPLWGVVAVAPYLHDGRADTLEEAILWHGGEGQASRDAFEALSSEERVEIIAFLSTLGGADATTPGLLPPQAPVPDVGEYGGPAGSLSDDELARFTRGRAFFDRDILYSEGLGPRFNGDSCRACHFEPVIGGARPLGVNVSRQRIFDAQGDTFEYPSTGTMAHRFDNDLAQRPPIDDRANVSELRQTPPLFGLGLIDRIPDDAILALADPNDDDGDGISGRAHILADGRLGRLGWKADVPNIEEFMRDALSNEVGMTLPERAGATFGALADADAVSDPELTDADYDDMLFYLEQLAPPPQQSVEVALEARGAEVFSEAGCDRCHVPSMQTGDGTIVALYSDLLLHELSDPEKAGIESGDAGMREFRTPPLWGISRTAPYMHDGHASALEAAIEAHAAEGAASREHVRALTAADRTALIAFLESL